MDFRFLAVPAVAAGLLVGAGADAATISYSASFGPKTVDFTGANAITQQINQFNPTLGTLNYITIAYTMSIETSNVSLTNTGADTLTGDVSALSTNTLIAPNFDEDVALAVTYVVPVGDPIASGDTRNFADGSDTETDNEVLFLAADVAPYIGTGMVDFTLSADGSASQDLSSSSYEFSVVTNGAGSVTVTYDYDEPTTPTDPDPIPAPALAGVFGLVAAGMGFARRR